MPDDSSRRRFLDWRPPPAERMSTSWSALVAADMLTRYKIKNKHKPELPQNKLLVYRKPVLILIRTGPEIIGLQTEQRRTSLVCVQSSLDKGRRVYAGMWAGIQNGLGNTVLSQDTSAVPTEVFWSTNYRHRTPQVHHAADKRDAKTRCTCPDQTRHPRCRHESSVGPCNSLDQRTILCADLIDTADSEHVMLIWPMLC